MQQPANGVSEQLKSLNWPTVALILASGAGNWFATQNTSNQLSYEQQEAIAKIRDLHHALDQFEARQHQMLTNQNHLMQTNSQLLADTNKIGKNIETWKHYEQMRGAP